MPTSPQVPIVTFFDPNKVDQGLIEYWSTERANDNPLDVGAPHPNTREFPNFRLGIQVALPNDDGWVRRVWVTDETSPDWWNYQLKFAAEAVAFPTYIRQYRIDKKVFVPLSRGSVLGSVIMVKKLTGGTGYTPGTLPDVTASGSGGFVGHGIVNLDGTIKDFVIDEGGSGYTSAPTLTVDAPPSGTTATAQALIQAQTAYLVAEQTEEFPKDSEFFGLYFNVTRVYETLPGPTLYTTRADDDGVTVTIATTKKVASSIITDPSETLISTVWTRTIKKQDTNTFTADEIYESRTIPGPLQTGEQTGKWGVEPIQKQKVAYGSVVDEGYLVRESKIEKVEGSNLVGQKITVKYPVGVYGVDLQGQDYDPRLDAVIPYVLQLRPQGNDIGVNREDITPIDYEHAEVRTIDPEIVRAVLNAYVFSYPGRINVDMPDILTAVYGVIESSTSDGADQETGANSLSGSGSVAQTLTAQSQASANILPEAYPFIKQFWGNNIACQHYHFFLENPVTLTDVLTKLNGILSPGSVSDWPKFNPEIVTVVMTGGRISVQAKAHSQGSYAISGTGTASTAAGGVGYSEERGLTIKTLRISPTIHDEIAVYGDIVGGETVTATAYAEAAGLGPLEEQTTGPINVFASISPSTIPATVGATTWPVSGLYLYRTDPHPYRYGFIEFHCVIVNAADFPNVP